MNLIAQLSAFAMITVASATFASAGTINLESYGTSGSQASGAANTPFTFLGYNPSTTYDTSGGSLVGGGGASYSLVMPTSQTTWASALPGSFYVSSDPGDGPGGSHQEPNGTYVYTSTFSLAPGMYGGTLSLLADDTATVKLNGLTIFSSATSGGYPHCASAVPNCMTVDTTSLYNSYFNTGLNTLEIDLVQGGSDRLGVDLSGSITPTPEPNSLLLLASGVVGSAGAALRRLRRRA